MLLLKDLDKSNLIMSALKESVFSNLDIALMLKNGSAAVFPTDTLPALAASPFSSEKLWKIKQRPLTKPLILMGANAEELFEFISPHVKDDAWRMANRFWPGALTMVLPAFGDLVNALNPGKESLGIRVPALGMAKELLSISGPLATTSANLSGEEPSLIAAEIANSFPGLPLLGPLPWPISKGMASTVLAWQSPGRWQVLRKGAVIIE